MFANQKKKFAMNERYHFGNSIGSGSYGQVLECLMTDAYHRYLVDKKVIPRDREKTPTRLAVAKIQDRDHHFFEDMYAVRELDILMRTKNYPGTVNLVDYYFEHSSGLPSDSIGSLPDPKVFLVLEQSEGSLDDFLSLHADNVEQRCEHLPLIVCQILLHLAYCEHLQIAHRDIKPQNILLDSAPDIFGWQMSGQNINGASDTSKCRLSDVRFANSKRHIAKPVRTLCCYFLPVAHNCSQCFQTSQQHPCDKTGSILPQMDKVRRKSHDLRQSGHYFSLKKPSQDAFDKTECAEREFKSKKWWEQKESKTLESDERDRCNPLCYGSAPSDLSKSVLLLEEHCKKSEMCEDDDGPFQWTLQQQTEEEMFFGAQHAPAVRLCDFGLSKHLNKRHHTPRVATVNYRPPELFFANQESAGDQLKSLLAPNDWDTDIASNLTAKQTNVNSNNKDSRFNTTETCDTSSDPNDFSAKLKSDAEYDTKLDIWAVGCIVAEMITGTALFPPKGEQNVWHSIKSLFAHRESASLEVDTCAQSSVSRTKKSGSFESTLSFSAQSFGDNNKLCDDTIESFAIDDIADASVRSSGDSSSSSSHSFISHSDRQVSWISSAGKRSKILKKKIYSQLVKQFRCSKGRGTGSGEVKARSVVHYLGDEFFDFLAALLDPRPNCRVGASRALQHPFIKRFVQPGLLIILCQSLSYQQQHQRKRHKAFACLRANSKTLSNDHIFDALPDADSKYHWWAHKPHVRAGAFYRNQMYALTCESEWTTRFLSLRHENCALVLQFCRQHQLHYFTLFSALYNYDRAIANYHRDAFADIIENTHVWHRMMAMCSLYMVYRYYERPFLNVEDVHLHFFDKLFDDFDGCLIVFINAVCGQLTLPSAWHFVQEKLTTLCEKTLKNQNVPTATQRQSFVTKIHKVLFGQSQIKKAKRLAKSRRVYSQNYPSNNQMRSFLLQIAAICKQRQEYFDTVLNNALFDKTILHSSFKKRCARLLFYVVQSHDEFYMCQNNKSIGHTIVARVAFNFVFTKMFS